MTKRVALVLALALFAACADGDLRSVANALKDTAAAVGSLQTTVIKANELSLIDDADTATILHICTKVSLAGKEATAITRGIAKLEQPERAKLFVILRPVVTVLDNAVTYELAGIKNDDTRRKVHAGLVAIQVGLAAAQLVLGSQ